MWGLEVKLNPLYMLKHHLQLIALSFLLILSTTVIHAEEPEKTEKVVATGYGVNADKAKENAVRNAVEQVIGTYVTSDTIVKNSQLVKDEILSFSGGYVKGGKRGQIYLLTSVDKV